MTNWNLGSTHALTNNLSLEVSYVGNHGSNLTGIRDLNMITPKPGHSDRSLPLPLPEVCQYDGETMPVPTTTACRPL